MNFFIQLILTSKQSTFTKLPVICESVKERNIVPLGEREFHTIYNQSDLFEDELEDLIQKYNFDRMEVSSNIIEFITQNKTSTFNSDKYSFDITAPSKAYFTNAREKCFREINEGLKKSMIEIFDLYQYSINKISIFFDNFNKRMINEVFSSENTDIIIKAKEKIYEEEVNLITKAVDLKNDSALNELLKIYNHMKEDYIKIIINNIIDMGEAMKKQFSEDFENYIKKMDDMFNSGESKILILNDQKMLDLIDREYCKLKENIKRITLKTTSDYFVYVDKECDKENNKTIEIFNIKNKELEERVINTLSSTISSFYLNICDEEIKNAVREVELIVSYVINGSAKVIEPILGHTKKYRAILNKERDIQISSIKTLLLKHNDKLVEDLMK